MIIDKYTTANSACSGFALNFALQSLINALQTLYKCFKATLRLLKTPKKAKKFAL